MAMPIFKNLEKLVCTLTRGVLDSLFPRPCIYCGGHRDGGGEFLCTPCLGDIAFIRRPLCEACGMPADVSYEFPLAGFLCGECRKNPHPFDRARSLGTYDTVLKELIHAFKYSPQPGAIADIAGLLERYFASAPEGYTGFYVAPVPLHFRKMRERGFDQSFLIAREVASVLNLPLASGLLSRIRDTGSQTARTRVERSRNIRGAFAVDRPEVVRGKDVLLVDDVFTTGATAGEAARVLKRAGAGRVHVFTLARVVV